MPNPSRLYQVLTLLVLLATPCSAAAPTETVAIPAARGTADTDAGLIWYDVALVGVEGRAFDDTEVYFDRLPSRAHGVVRDAVWNLSRHSAGMCVRFVTDAPDIHVRWTLRSERLAMPHMAATGVSGVDLYVRDDSGAWRWLAVGQPKKFPINEQQLTRSLPPGRREYRLYLPLYNGVKQVEIGLPSGTTLSQPPTYDADRAPDRLSSMARRSPTAAARREPAWHTSPSSAAASTDRPSTWAFRATAAWRPRSPS